MSATDDLAATARSVIDTNHYMTLATLNSDGGPRVSPLYYTAARYADFYWVSSPEAQHSRNLEHTPEVEIVIFNSSVPVSATAAVYVGAHARVIEDDELPTVIDEAFRTTAGARAFHRVELQGKAPLRLYVAHATRTEVHVPGRHPLNPTGVDVRLPANPSE
jgi:general stress protein 26